MISNLGISLSSNISTYDARDYRRIMSSHFQYLKGLCQISLVSVNISIKQFLLTLFVTNQLLSEDDLNQQMNSTIDRTKSNAPNTLHSIFYLIRSLTHGNAIASTYETNFKYYATGKYPLVDILLSRAMMYDNGCSCGLHSNCTSQAYFIGNSSLENILINGLKIGCTPSQSLLDSTLECFYDDSCINIVKKHVNYTQFLEPLSIETRAKSRMNTTVGELFNNLFVEQWLTTINYLSYFKQCSPSLCSYNYIQKFSIIYIISFLLSLQGGLTIVLKWLCPKIVRMVLKLNQYRKKHINNVVHPFGTVTNRIINENMTTITNVPRLSSRPVTSQYASAIF